MVPKLRSISSHLRSKKNLILEGVICTGPIFLVFFSVGIFVIPLVAEIFVPSPGDTRNIILRILPTLPILCGVIAVTTLWRHVLAISHGQPGVSKIFLVISIMFAAVASIFLFVYFPLAIAFLVCLPAWLYAFRLAFI